MKIVMGDNVPVVEKRDGKNGKEVHSKGLVYTRQGIFCYIPSRGRLLILIEVGAIPYLHFSIHVHHGHKNGTGLVEDVKGSKNGMKKTVGSYTSGVWKKTTPFAFLVWKKDFQEPGVSWWSKGKCGQKCCSTSPVLASKSAKKPSARLLEGVGKKG